MVYPNYFNEYRGQHTRACFTNGGILSGRRDEVVFATALGERIYNV